MVNELRITEIFHSLQGEAATVGRPTVFVRLTGCPLRCEYCDSEYAFHGGQKHSITHIVEEVLTFCCPYVCVTGGEPLAQKGVLELLSRLCDKGLKVSLETSGAISLEGVDPRVAVVMDLKTPASKESDKNLYSNIARLKPNDQVKFVLCDEGDYQWAKFKIDEYHLTERVSEVLMSPSHGSLKPQTLADWIINDSLQVRFQIQLHKFLWGDTPGV